MHKTLLALAALAVFFVAPSQADERFVPYEPAAFESLIESGVPVVVHVHADWCPTCRRQISIFDELFKDPALDEIQAVRVNYDTDREFRAAYKVTRQATIIAFRDGKEVARVVYDTNVERIHDALKAAL
jgi:thiol-disulfide isomerase/thioredoxin